MIYDALFKDVRALMTKGVKPDLVVFSGDIVANGDDYESFSLALDKVIEPLLRDTELDESRIFLVPGNHDVQRSTIHKEEITQEGLEARLIDRDKLNQFYMNNTNHEYVRLKLKHFIELKECLGNSTLTVSDLFFDAYYVRELDIALACINTAWMSRGGLSGSNDRQRLLVPEASVRSALDAFPDTRTKILVGHHPLDWLAEYAHEDLRRLVEREFTMYLHGHMHEPISGDVRSTIGHTLVHQSGALYTDRRRYNGYAVIAVNPTHGHVKINLRSFYERREQFDAAIDVAPDGCWYSSETAEAFFENLPEPLDTTEVFQWVTDRLGPALVETLDEGFSDRPVSEIFVAPRLSKRSADTSSPEGEPVDEYETCPLSDLILGKGNFLIVAKPQFGKTTLLRQVALGIIRDPSQSQIPAAPCVIEFTDIKPGRNRLRNYLRAQLPDTDGYPFTFNDLLSGGHLVVLVDDVDLTDPRRWKTLANFIKEHPRNRFLLTTDSHLLDQFDMTTSLATAAPFQILRMEPFSRKEMRALVERWDFKAGTQDKESVLDRLVNDIVNINVPLTPVNGTILLTIFDLHGDFTPINRAVLIETFIETLLEKHSLRQALRARFDFRNKVHLLSHFAAYMAKQDTYRLSYDKLLSVSRAYFAAVGLPDQSSEQINDFISAKILEHRDGTIAFRYRAFLEYFIAEQMKDNFDFKDWVLDESNYLSFGNEIGYYAGIKRNDVALLDLIGERFESLGRELEKQTGWIKDLNTINDIIPPPLNDFQRSFLEGIEGQLEAPPLSAEERDEILEAEVPRDVGDRQEVFRPLYEEVGEQWTGCLLLYSDVIKNSELVPDHSKRLHLGRALRGWSQFTYHALLLIPALVKHRKVVVNGIGYNVLFPSSWSDAKVARGLYMATPRAISDLIRLCLATEKLEVQLREPSLDEVNEALIAKFYRITLYGDLRLNGFLEVLKKFEASIAQSRYLSEAYICKLRQMLVRLPLSKDEDIEFRKLLAGFVGRLLPGSVTERQRRTSRELHQLEQWSLLRQLRIQAQERAEARGTES